MDGEERPNFTERCRLSDPLFPHSLRRRDNPPPSECFRCGPVRYEFEEGGWHYYCDICKVVFHNDSCHVFPQGMRHPHHPNHTLNTAIQYSETEIFSFNKNLFEISMLMAVVAIRYITKVLRLNQTRLVIGVKTSSAECFTIVINVISVWAFVASGKILLLRSQNRRGIIILSLFLITHFLYHAMFVGWRATKSHVTLVSHATT
ncbi:hypothetical protein DY000_02028097 [Brassica cretica]|uniref:DC1 domain-containing protein n=1 Tax=Brassica cretica TaxID=69181 RepID=A0ABQ7EMV8_BRACR|nr:hypothetical protein DY000_02028097 [Brassica cretica]